MRRVLLVTVALVGMGAASAEAHHPIGLRQSLAIARATFPGACEPTVPADHSMPFGNLGSAWTVAWSRGPLNETDECLLGTSERIHTYRPSRICTFIVHEYGHLAGLEHSDDPNSVMHPNGPVTYSPCLGLDSLRPKSVKCKRPRGQKKRLCAHSRLRSAPAS